ncbi:hypothetical protein RFI_15098 [Reticulomyxa filosa]|uniref:F-box domain-containing protein n=1 Tax=Reticulomyxa filosa TaxID=46433 RepID=X6N7S9_RETFI|nr:hypothetical protein RFI_15098 [Reticulomyxa filosa]|eukprot:ETO22106.1 hypothetical protein RFI_15098 [Reticulomyxa filosa]
MASSDNKNLAKLWHELPDDMLRRAVSYAITTPKDLARLNRVNVQFRKALRYTSPGASLLWEQLARFKWPYLSKSLHVQRWDKFFQIRLGKIKRFHQSDEAFVIENCGLQVLEKVLNDNNKYVWVFKCPFVSSFSRGETYPTVSGVEFCKTCKRNVYVVKNEAELEEKQLFVLLFRLSSTLYDKLMFLFFVDNVLVTYTLLSIFEHNAKLNFKKQKNIFYKNHYTFVRDSSIPSLQ